VIDVITQRFEADAEHDMENLRPGESGLNELVNLSGRHSATLIDDRSRESAQRFELQSIDLRESSQNCPSFQQ